MVKAKALRLHLVGDKHRTLQYEEVEVPQPCSEEVEVRHTAIAVHPWDQGFWQCRGAGSDSIKLSLGEPLHLPQTLGLGAAGVVTELGSGVLNLQIGQRVVYSTLPSFSKRAPGSNNDGLLAVVSSAGLKNAPLGSFCDTRVLPAECLVPVPPDIDDDAAAAVFLPGLAALVLVRKLSHMKPGQAALVHCVSSGGALGAILCQWLRCLGVSVVGTVHCEEDIPQAKFCGCGQAIVLPSSEKKQSPLVVAVPERAHAGGQHLQEMAETERETIKLGEEEGADISQETTLVVEEVMAATQGRGVDVVFALEACEFAESVCPSGTAVRLEGSLADHFKSRPELFEASIEVFDLLVRGILRLPSYSKVSRSYRERKREVSGSEVLRNRLTIGSNNVQNELRFGSTTIRDTAAKGQVAILVPPVPDPASVPTGS